MGQMLPLETRILVAMPSGLGIQLSEKEVVDVGRMIVVLRKIAEGGHSEYQMSNWAREAIHFLDK
jgi:hypothetical protein